MNSAVTQAQSATSKGAVLAIIMASYLMIVIDISIVLTGLPRIQGALGFSTPTLSWVQNAYTLAFGGFLLLGARAGDIWGRKRMFMLGLAIFTLASVAIGAALSPAWMLVFRAIQGLGAAVLAPSTLALISTHFAEGPERNRALSWYAAAAGMGATVGLVLGGVLTDLISWRAGFFINLPIGLLLIAAAHRFIQETPRHAGRIDVAGALSATMGMGALVFGIVAAAESGWGSVWTDLALAMGLVLLTLFLWHQARATQPLLPLRLFANKSRNTAYAARLLFLAGMVGFWFFTSQYLQKALGLSPMLAGLAFVPVTVPQFLSSISVPSAIRRLGQRTVLLMGLALCMVGLLWAGLSASLMSYLFGMVGPMVLIGLGQGWVLAPLTMAAVAGVKAEDAGAASGLVNVAHQLGASLGLAVLVVVFASSDAGTAGSVMHIAHATGATLETSALMVFLAFLLAALFLFRPSLPLTQNLAHPHSYFHGLAENFSFKKSRNTRTLGSRCRPCK